MVSETPDEARLGFLRYLQENKLYRSPEEIREQQQLEAEEQ